MQGSLGLNPVFGFWTFFFLLDIWPQKLSVRLRVQRQYACMRMCVHVSVPVWVCVLMCLCLSLFPLAICTDYITVCLENTEGFLQFTCLIYKITEKKKKRWTYSALWDTSATKEQGSHTLAFQKSENLFSPKIRYSLIGWKCDFAIARYTPLAKCFGNVCKYSRKHDNFFKCGAD